MRAAGRSAVGIGAALTTHRADADRPSRVAGAVRVGLALHAHHGRQIAGAVVVGRRRAIGVGHAAERAGVLFMPVTMQTCGGVHPCVAVHTRQRIGRHVAIRACHRTRRVVDALHASPSRGIADRAIREGAIGVGEALHASAGRRVAEGLRTCRVAAACHRKGCAWDPSPSSRRLCRPCRPCPAGARRCRQLRPSRSSHHGRRAAVFAAGPGRRRRRRRRPAPRSPPPPALPKARQFDTLSCSPPLTFEERAPRCRDARFHCTYGEKTAISRRS